MKALTLWPGRLVSRFWCEALDGDEQGFELYRRHYSAGIKARARSRSLFVGPGQKMVLLSPLGDALFVWRKYIDDGGQLGVNCAVFRNEGRCRSSEMILDAEEVAERRWPGERKFTFVDASKVRSVNPGWCFQCAGWVKCGVTKSGLVVLEKVFVSRHNGPSLKVGVNRV